ncbi:MAG: methyl-accepting chemotaxis protein [Desulfomonile tiedjei]|uniref:Methyl-accepting chemotaxis protein n=1 Tax=Desulfomonile tiedjei TaxID=2358 RepID=A0A9D6UZM1_9BACT|nr:methyl-accepting chemotaxis protein [Desulfomonile tiedjei]
MRLRDVGLKTKIIFGGLIPVALAVLTFIGALYGLQAVLRSVYLVDHTHRAIRIYQEIYGSVLEMGSGLRGYILTGSENPLAAYNRGKENIDRLFPDLKNRLTSAERLKLANEAQEIIEDWKKNTAIPAIALRREIGNAKDMNDMAALVIQANDTKHFGRFGDQVSAFVDVQKKAVEQIKSDAAKAVTVEETRKALQVVDDSYRSIEHVMEIYSAALDMAYAERGYLISGKEDFLGSYNSLTKRVLELINKQKETLAGNPSQVKSLHDIEDSLKAWMKDVAQPEISLRKQIASSRSASDIQDLVARGDDKKKSLDKFREVMNSFQENVEGVLKERQKSADDTAAMARQILIAGMVLTAVLAIVISYFLARSITKPLALAVDLAEGISQGILSKKLELEGRDEVGRLCSSLNRMAQSLGDQTRRLVDGINVLAASSSEISTTVAQMALGASKTSAAVSETTTTVEEVKQAAKTSSEKAKKVTESAQQAVQISESGRKATEDTVLRINLIKEQMESIGETVIKLSEHSQRIEQIIEAVQDLADQSNLLAVNASIEAARAGEQGKGFAVVAQEIKTLADQSKAATEQVRNILDDTKKWVSAVVMATEQGGKAVDAGVQQAIRAGESIQSLANSVTASSQAAVVIQTSSEQQFVGVDQVSMAMANIEQSVQQTSSGTAQLDSAAKRIADLGGLLKEMAERYKL